MKYKKVECDICGSGKGVDIRDIQTNTCGMCCLVACDRCIDTVRGLCVYCSEDEDSEED